VPHQARGDQLGQSLDVRSHRGSHATGAEVHDIERVASQEPQQLLDVAAQMLRRRPIGPLAVHVACRTHLGGYRHRVADGSGEARQRRAQPFGC